MKDENVEETVQQQDAVRFNTGTVKKHRLKTAKTNIQEKRNPRERRQKKLIMIAVVMEYFPNIPVKEGSIQGGVSFFFIRD